MKRLLKIFSIGVISLLLFLTSVLNVHAASATVSVLSSSNKVVVGKTFKITVKVSSAVALGSWEYTLNYDSSLVSLISSDVSLHYAGYGDGSSKSKSYSYTFKALKSGKANFSVSKTSIYDWNENNLAVTNGGRSVSLITQAELEASYSSNNDLSSLGITGYELTPSFTKNTTSYNLSLPSTVTKINITGSKADNTASITGTGEFDVSEGLNTFNVIVTAQNGNVKTYTLNVTVEDLNPIVVKINKEEYTVVKRADLVSCPSTYLESAIKINETDIPTCKNEVSAYTLVGLKDSSGDVKLFVYNADTNEYTKYIEFSLNSVIISPLETVKMIKGYEKDIIKINGEKVNALVLPGSTYALIYGKNIETGKTGFYTYDRKENTFQRYYQDEAIKLQSDLKDYLIIIIIFGTGLFIAIVLIIVLFCKKNNKKKPNTFVEKIMEETKEELKEENKTKKSKKKNN